MDPITQNSTTLPQPIPSVSSVIPTSTSKKHVLIWIIGGVIILCVGIGIGLFFDKNLSPTPQISPTPIPSPMATANPIANWKTYENTKFAYSIKYPPSLTPLETTSDIYLNQVAFNGPEKTYLSGTIVEVRDLTNLEDEISYRTWRIVGHIAEKLDSEIPVTISGLPGKRLNYTSGQKQFSTIIIPYQKLVYSIEAESSLLDQILSTFKFLGQDVAQ